MVGSFEQVYMENGCMDDEVCPGENTHQELAPTSMLSVIANLMSFFEFNEPPRTMYRCQMGDAMILNKSTHEHGFGYGAIYKSEIVDLGDFRIHGEPVLHHFGLGLDPPRSWRGKLDKDGLLCIGVTLQDGDPICSYLDDTTGNTSVKKCKPSVDMPFSESRNQPDVIINPYTLRLLKMRHHSPSTADDYFGDQLKAAGYNHHGNEPMYSVITGEDFKAHIYLEVS
ncbi:hypothetical protein EDD21DRAFT_409816 [Dissophora ornata]|nr:hypothetical protein EDD21DRAFT_409816 [Dissophora ornata]